MERGAWLGTVYGVAKSWRQTEQLSLISKINSISLFLLESLGN